MKVTIQTKTAGAIEISNKFLGNKRWDVADKHYPANYNNHKVTVVRNGKRMTFDFWQSLAQPDMKRDSDLIFALYCVLQDAYYAQKTFEEFCDNFGYNTDNRSAEKLYNGCQKHLGKVEYVFDNVDLVKLLNELQDKWHL